MAEKKDYCNCSIPNWDFKRTWCFRCEKSINTPASNEATTPPDELDREAQSLIEEFGRLNGMSWNNSIQCAIIHCKLMIAKLDKIQKENVAVFLNGEIRRYEKLKTKIESL